PEVYTRSLHDALPIYWLAGRNGGIHQVNHLPDPARQSNGIGIAANLDRFLRHPQLRASVLESDADRIRVEVAQRLRVRIEARDAHSVGEVVLPSPDRIDLRASSLAPLIDRSLLEDDEAVIALLERPRDECTAASREEHGNAGKKRCRPLFPAAFNLHPTLDADLDLGGLLLRVERDDPARKRSVYSLLPIAEDRLHGFGKLSA